VACKERGCTTNLRVSGKFENPEDPEDSEGDEGAGDLVVVAETQADVVGHDGDEVDDAHDGPHELAAVGRRVQAQEIFGREDHDAGRVQAEEHNLVLVAARLDLIPAGDLRRRTRKGE